jgi:hypothetical protein
MAMDQHPGKWLLWMESNTASATTRLRKLGYEATCRSIGEKRWAIYARRPEGWEPTQ